MSVSPTEYVFAQGADSLISREPFPNSRKIYVQGSDPTIQVGMREIRQSATQAGRNGLTAEDNPPITVYDASGPYTDPDIALDVRKGIPAIRLPWILRRGDVDTLDAGT
jgi:phosphomethylpyrimidine synthase